MADTALVEANATGLTRRQDSSDLVVYETVSGGHLAPRGGANNVCDESKPYSDSVELTVRMRGGDGGQRDGPCVCGVVVLVRTEEDSWLFQLVAGSDGVSPAAGAAAAYPAAEAVDEEWQ